MATNPVDRAISILKALPEDKARAATHFLESLVAGDEEATATLEILEDTELMAAVNAAEEARKKGRLEEFVPWKTVKRNV